VKEVDAVLDASSILSDVSVLDLTRNLAGPYCTMLLGDLGADVIKVESASHGDDTRRWRPPEWNGESATFLACNRNKRSLAVDLDTEAGQNLVRDLAQEVDVIVSSFRPGSLQKRGLDYEAISRLNSDVIYCSISAYGSTGPKKDLPGYDPVIQAESGLMDLTGYPDALPARLGIAANDLGTALWATVGIQAALRVREQSGKGTFLEVSLFETAAWWLSYYIAGYMGSGVAPHRQGTEASFLAPYEAFETAEGQLMITAGNDNLFAALCEGLGLPELARTNAFQHNADRVANREELHVLLEARLLERTAAEWQAVLREHQVPCSPVRTIEDFVADEQLAALSMLVPVFHPSVPDLEVVDTPLSFDGQRPGPHRPPPLLGQHTEEVLSFLGYSEREIANLANENVIKRPD
jgi:crotonobetainyl-CoA:carnitine CoA-transferase CaiB-like acyl-CoA transferase